MTASGSTKLNRRAPTSQAAPIIIIIDSILALYQVYAYSLP